MNYVKNLSFLSRLLWCMALSFLINIIVGFSLQSLLTQEEYLLEVDAIYSSDSSMEFHYDSGIDFNNKHEVVAEAKKGTNLLQFPFKLEKGAHLKYLRLDFGSDNKLDEVTLNAIRLYSENRTLFNLKKEKIISKIGLFRNVSKTAEQHATLFLDTSSDKFDPYINFISLRDLILPKWLQVLLLVAPWIILFGFKALQWCRTMLRNKEYQLFWIALFLISIPLKIAWVSFTTILLLGYALFIFYKKKRIRFSTIQVAVSSLFLISLIFLHHGAFSNVTKSLGFLFFPIIFSVVDFSKNTAKIQKIYTHVFFILMAILLVSWLTLILSKGYYYKITLFNYFTEIKSHAHIMMFWLYYAHTTFISFFILVGFVFCRDLYGKGKVSKQYITCYGIFSLFAIVLLGSRFALLLILILPFLHKVSIKNIIVWGIPIFLTTGIFISYFMDHIDPQRSQLWSTSWTGFKNRVFFGNGTGSSAALLDHIKLVKQGEVQTSIDFNHSHNQYMTYLLETGLLGTSLFLIILCIMINKFADDNNKAMIIVNFIIIFLMLIESPFETATPLYVISFLWSVFSPKEILGHTNSIK